MTVPVLKSVVEDQPRSGADNMAIDEALLQEAVENRSCYLRLYRWAEPTVSLGYFQKETDPVLTSRFEGLPRVKRLSGGGALLHHHELTYSIALPDGHVLADEPTALYDRVHQALVALLNARGADARVRGEKLSEPEPFLCFGRGDPRDVVLRGYKVVGSAQRRRKGAILQHGALLLERSEWASEFPGLFDLVPETRADQAQWMEWLSLSIRDALQMPFESGELPVGILQRAAAMRSGSAV